MALDYDPFSDEVMRDPFPLYAAMRAKGGPHYIEKYNAWALARFEDVWEASSRHEKDITFTAGQTPGQLLLGEDIPATFATMDAPAHRKWRGIVRKAYSPDAAQEQRDRFRQLSRDILQPLRENGEFDVYKDYFNRIFCLNSGYNLGLPVDDAILWRGLIDDMLHRDPGQMGSGSERNQNAAMQLGGYLFEYVQKIRQNPALASGHTEAYLNAEIDGEKLDDQGLVNILFSFLVLGSETTPMVCAGALYYLAERPELKAQIMADRSLLPKLFFETCRYDQPTNMLCRRAVNDFELGGAQIKAGQNLLYIYAAANRDADEFDRPDEFDIQRTYERDLTYGTGGHKCLGMHVATVGAITALEELLASVSDYEVLVDQCERAYGEHLSGFLRVPIRVTP